MEKQFGSQTLAEIFRDLYLEERSGVLHLARTGDEKRIYFDRGMILFGESNAEDEDLGRRLVSEGKISPGALAEAQRNISEPKDLAQALVNRGLIGKEALSHTVRFIVEQVVQGVFRWEGGNSRFNEGYLLQEIFEGDILSTFEMILKGIGTMVGFEPIHQALKGMENKLQIRQPTPVPVERLALSPAHGFILSRVDGSTNVADVLSILPHGEEALACRFLYGLLVMGVMKFDPPVADGRFHVTAILKDHADQVALESLQEKMVAEWYESLRNKPPHEVLGVSIEATREEIEAAYGEAKERVGRDRLVPRLRDRLRSELAVIESRLLDAYLTLIQIPTGSRERRASAEDDELRGDDLLVRVEMDKTKSKKELEASSNKAEEYYLKARRFAREGDFYNAIQYGKLAISYQDEDARFHFLVGDCQRRNPDARWQRMAEQNYLRAAELDRWNPEYRLVLGRFYKSRGMQHRARKQFEEVLQLAPSNEEAVAELEAL